MELNKQRKLLDELLEIINKENASDLHISEGRYPTVRIDGTLIPVTLSEVLTSEDIQEIIKIFLPPESRVKFIEEKEFDFS
jgi:Tfp pilus assembly pilus retraction ATPase PilT